MVFNWSIIFTCWQREACCLEFLTFRDSPFQLLNCTFKENKKGKYIKLLTLGSIDQYFYFFLHALLVRMHSLDHFSVFDLFFCFVDRFL